MKKIHPSVLLFFVFLFGCTTTSNKEKEISNVSIDFDFITFHKDFFGDSDAKKLERLLKKYPYLFPAHTTEEEWLLKSKDSEEKVLFEMVDSLYGNLEKEKEILHKVYQHINYYKPSFKAPKTFTLINGLDYENAVVYADTLLFISLDMYLGKNAEVYQSFPPYIANNYTEQRIAVDVAQKIIQKQFKSKRGRSFLESMVYYGKELFLVKTMLPNTPMHVILGITEEKYNWSLHNEAQIWKYFISENLLFSTENSLNNRFINTAPFSKFYLESDSESPGQIGTWIGLKIVESYMKNNSTSVDQMIQVDAETLFKKSKYKPVK